MAWCLKRIKWKGSLCDREKGGQPSHGFSRIVACVGCPSSAYILEKESKSHGKQTTWGRGPPKRDFLLKDKQISYWVKSRAFCFYSHKGCYMLMAITI